MTLGRVFCCDEDGNEVVFAIGVLLDFRVTSQMRNKLFGLWLEWRCVVLGSEYEFLMVLEKSDKQVAVTQVGLL